MSIKGIWATLKTAGSRFIADDALTHAAAIAFYSALSFAPLLVITLTVVGFLGESQQQQVVQQIQGLVGEQAGQMVETVVQNAGENQDTGTIAGIIGLAVVLFSASGVFVQLQYALNTMWHVEPRPDAGVWGWMRRRLLSMGLIFGVLFLLLVSLVVSAGLSIAFNSMGGAGGTVWRVVNLLVSLAVIAGLFGLIFKFLPDVKMSWGDVAMGAVVTAVLFVVGKYLIGLYLGYGSVGSGYGAAGSLLVLLVWVYYSSLIVLFGVELTQAYATRYGARLTPDEHAQWIDGQPPSAAAE